MLSYTHIYIYILPSFSPTPFTVFEPHPGTIPAATWSPNHCQTSLVSARAKLLAWKTHSAKLWGGLALAALPPWYIGQILAWYQDWHLESIGGCFTDFTNQNAGRMETKRDKVGYDMIMGYSGWWFGTCFIIFYVCAYWECHHPNWLSYCSEGWVYHQPGIYTVHIHIYTHIYIYIY